MGLTEFNDFALEFGLITATGKLVNDKEYFLLFADHGQTLRILQTYQT